ncbi:MAG: PfaD family polyunsaturated fatty acid/polyketide biosynthesis protein [Anaerolineae bacterium]|nr:PfaD family polyunsaturated fatty acid/polyketide biosynthesis protein [Anaerolineae bacterium]
MENRLLFDGNGYTRTLGWEGPVAAIAFAPAEVRAKMRDVTRACYIVQHDGATGVTNVGQVIVTPNGNGVTTLGMLPALSPKRLGDPTFLATYGLDYAYMTGSMANAIASEEMVIALGRAGMLGAFGAGGLIPQRLVVAICKIQAALPDGPYCFNLIHSPNEPALEHSAVQLYLDYGVRVVEASAYLQLTPYLVQYRAAGLRLNARGEIEIQNRVIAKVSRREVAMQFLHPAPAKLLQQLVTEGTLTAQQAALAEKVPMADDITIEADSGGHTDNRPLVCILPSIIALRDEVQAHYGYATPVRIGAAGGIGTPAAVLGAFMMGAAYVVTGSVNHSCVEAGTSPHVKSLLAQAAATDVMMAPAADMFEMGVNLQVLKRGTLFPLRARKLYQLYQLYQGIDDIPAAERAKLETQIFQRSLDAVWEDCVAFFNLRDPGQIERAVNNPKRKMALIFRWYLGLATRWGIKGERGRELDYQIWCGPAMGAFNDWVRASYLEAPEQRYVADVGRQLMTGAAFLYRVQHLRMQGISVPVEIARYVPEMDAG